jgi:hypothetical protein
MRSHLLGGDTSHRHTFDGQVTQPVRESEEENEDGVEWVDE